MIEYSKNLVLSKIRQGAVPCGEDCRLPAFILGRTRKNAVAMQSRRGEIQTQSPLEDQVFPDLVLSNNAPELNERQGQRGGLLADVGSDLRANNSRRWPNQPRTTDARAKLRDTARSCLKSGEAELTGLRAMRTERKGSWRVAAKSSTVPRCWLSTQRCVSSAGRHRDRIGRWGSSGAFGVPTGLFSSYACASPLRQSAGDSFRGGAERALFRGRRLRSALREDHARLVHNEPVQLAITRRLR